MQIEGAVSRYFKAEVGENIELNETHSLLTFAPNLAAGRARSQGPVAPISQGPVAPPPEPGQFYMVAAGTASSVRDPLLKRPFCFFRKTRRGIQILYRLKGKGTALMKGLKKGSLIDVIGPLGNSYPLPEKGQTPLIIAGGVGIASVFPLIGRLKKKAYVLYGARTKSELLMLDELKTLAGKLRVSTEDGSYGRSGTVCDLLPDLLKSRAEKFVLYACGPKGMLKAVSEIVADMGGGSAAYVSLEENMACGVGACLGCAVKTKDGYKRVCKEGPVFKMEDIVWER